MGCKKRAGFDDAARAGNGGMGGQMAFNAPQIDQAAPLMAERFAQDPGIVSQMRGGQRAAHPPVIMVLPDGKFAKRRESAAEHH